MLGVCVGVGGHLHRLGRLGDAMSAQPGTSASAVKKARAAYAGRISSATVPQPLLGRCWNSPTESWSEPLPWCG